MLLGFLEGYDVDARGRKLHEIWEFSDNQIERTHDFIQWLFPLTEPSQSQPASKTLARSLRAHKKDTGMVALIPT